MKAMNLLKVSKFWGTAFAFLCLATARPVTAQVLVPGGSMFLLPPLAQYVRIVSPANYSTFYAPVDIPIFAFAHEGTLAYTNVDFYYSGTNAQGKGFTNLLGPGFSLSSTNAPVTYVPIQVLRLRPEPRLLAEYCFVWTNAPVGTYSLRAVARGLGLGGLDSMTRTSAPVNITIIAGVTNTNPTDVVNIVATDPVAIAGTNVCWIWRGVTNTTPSWTNWPQQPTKGWGYVTNWGPKNALFAVNRLGDASTNLTIGYTVSGTASNGLDYVELPGSVTIPAGQAYALIPVVPIYDGKTNFSKTVVLSLVSDTNTPPDYKLGLPSRAAALIMDYWPRPLPMLLADRSFHLNTNGPDGAWFYVENSTNLQSWTCISTNQVVHGSIDYIDPDAPNFSGRFYRAVPLTNSLGH